ncbi:hypothetical protein CIK80_13115 [Psychrobacter sp. JB193]|nr:hypothetical protein CIK80_13115 [Psychrobacter sp. JB193]
MDEVKKWPVRTMEVEEAHALIRQIVPHDSPLSVQVQSEPPRDCRRLNFLREYDNENTKLYP